MPHPKSNYLCVSIANNTPIPCVPTTTTTTPRPPSPIKHTQVGAQTETELKEKKLRVEDALNATKAAVEEGIVIGGGCTLLKLAAKVDAIKDTLSNEEQKVRGGSGGGGSQEAG
jgi:hypothetical protein